MINKISDLGKEATRRKKARIAKALKTRNRIKKKSSSSKFNDTYPLHSLANFGVVQKQG
jgi:hypothetical protein